MAVLREDAGGVGSGDRQPAEEDRLGQEPV
jgi:hypothetical protein